MKATVEELSWEAAQKSRCGKLQRKDKTVSSQSRSNFQITGNLERKSRETEGKELSMN